MEVKEISRNRYAQNVSAYGAGEETCFQNLLSYRVWLEYDGLRDNGCRFYEVLHRGAPIGMFYAYRRNDVRASYKRIKYFLPVWAVDGAMLFFPDIDVDLKNDALNALLSFMKSVHMKTALGLRITINPLLIRGEGSLVHHAEALGYTRESHGTIILNLLQHDTVDSLWAGIDGKARTKVNRAVKAGVVVDIHAITVENYEEKRSVVDQFGRVMSENRERLGLRPPRINHDEYRSFLQAGNGMVHYLFAFSRLDGEVLSAQQATVVKGGAVVLQGVSISQAGLESRLPGNDLVQWEMIKYCKEKGFASVDWAGYTLEPADEKQEAINRFKEKWGGAIIRYPQFLYKRPLVPSKLVR